MKKLTLLIAIIMIMPLITLAQSNFGSIIQQYQGVKGFTTVNMTHDMFDALGDMANESLPKGIEGMLILTFDRKKAEKDYPLYSELKSIIDKEDYKTFMDVNEGDQNVHFLVKKKKGEESVSEFLMLVHSPDETTFIWMNGKLNLNDLQKMGNAGNMFGQPNNKEKINDEENAKKGGKIK